MSEVTAMSSLTTLDYVVIGVSLILSSGYGLYCSNRRAATKDGLRQPQERVKKNSTHEYLLAGQNMGVLPVAFSYFATVASTGVIIGYPNEVYTFGFQVVLIIFATIPATMIVNEVFLPVYKSLPTASVYEYLELRFNKSLKNFVTAFVVFQAIVLSSANVYGPSTVLSSVTGVNTWVIVGGLSGLCIIYTTFGGIRAVILADVIQAVLIFVSVGLLLIGGIVYVGGLNLTIDRNLHTQRLDIFNFDSDLTVRQTFWTTIIGYFFTFLSLTSTSQFAMQRFMTTPNLQVAQRANILGNCLYMLSLLLSQSLGLVAYAAFHGCDPLKEGSIKNMDQLLPALVMKTLTYPALPGMIFTGILCASLSTLSSVYNSTATIVYLSFIKPGWPHLADETATLVCKVLAFTVGILSVVGVLFVELFPNVVQSMISVFSVVSAPLLGLLLIGIFIPRGSVKSASMSFTLSVVMMLWIVVGSLFRNVEIATKPLIVDECLSIGNASVLSFQFANETLVGKADDVMTDANWDSYFPLSSISFMWYSTMGTLATLIMFAIASIFTGGDVKQVDCLMLDSIPEIVQKLHRNIPVGLRRFLLCDVYMVNGLDVRSINPEVQYGIKQDESIAIKTFDTVKNKNDNLSH